MTTLADLLTAGREITSLATNDYFLTHDTSDATTDADKVVQISTLSAYLAALTQTLTNKTLTAPVIATIVNTGTLTLPTSTDTLVGRATTDTLTNKTLTTPTIASFTNATHDHSNAAGGGTLSGYLAATGATTGATSQVQAFTNGLKTPSIQPASDSTTAVQIQTASGTTVLAINTTNKRVVASGLIYSGASALWDGTTFPPTAGIDFNGSANVAFFHGIVPSPDAGSGQDIRYYSRAGGAGGYHRFFCGGVESMTLNASSFSLGSSVAFQVKKAQIDVAAWDAATYPLPTGVVFSNSGSATFASGVVFGNNNLYYLAPASGDTNKHIFRVAGTTYFIINDSGKCAIGHGASPLAYADVAAGTSAIPQARWRGGAFPTTPSDGDWAYVSAGRLQFRRGATTEIVATGVQATGGVATAGGTYGATEQTMLQAVYNAARTFGLLS